MTRQPDRTFQQALREHLVARIDRIPFPAVPPEERPSGRLGRLRLLSVSLVVAATIAASWVAIAITDQHRQPASAGRSTQQLTPTPTSTPVSCKSLLGSASEKRLADRGYVLSGDEYIDKVAADPTSVLREFVIRQGAACRWGTESGDVSALVGYGPITTEDAAVQIRQLLRDGATRISDAGYQRYTLPDDSVGGYAFGNGSWAYALDTTGIWPTRPDLLDQVLTHAPQF